MDLSHWLAALGGLLSRLLVLFARMDLPFIYTRDGWQQMKQYAALLGEILLGRLCGVFQDGNEEVPHWTVR